MEALNRRLRFMAEFEGMDYGEDTSDPDKLAKKFQDSINITREHIRQVMTKVKKAQVVDFCFLLDATGSMGFHIEGVTNSIKKIVKTLDQSRQTPGGITKIRFGLVIYRDFGDEEQVRSWSFTENPDQFIEISASVETPRGSGGDAAEDVFSGLEAVNRMNWSSDAGTRILFHICDAPCHGLQFHNMEGSDDYPDGDPHERTADDLLGILKAKKIFYYFGKIDPCTDKMIDEFSKVYGDFITEFDVKEVENISGSIITSIKTSVDTNTCAAFGSGDATVELDSTEPQWQSVELYEVKLKQYQLPNSINEASDNASLSPKSPMVIWLKIAQKPFDKGAERLVFYAQAYFTPGSESALLFDNESIVDLVVKKFMNERGGEMRYRTTSEIQTLAQFFALKFCDEVQIPRCISFLQSIQLEAARPEDSFKYLSCERRLSQTSSFIRFTNNLSYAESERDLQQKGVTKNLIHMVMAFSHWTWHATDGFMLVADLQGAVLGSGANQNACLTDPAIHCKDTTRYTPTNLGHTGIKSFFKSHKCNEVCERLSLKRPLAEETDC